jgi:predicted Zn-dependent peptidase
MIINLKSQTDLSGFYVVFYGSTNFEERGIYGISHLMEHLICKNFEHLRDDFEKEGIEWNAYTTQNEIVFYFTGLDEYLMKQKYELVELITDFKVSKEQFENERKIILQEYKNHFSDQSNCHLSNLSRKLYKDYDAIGLKEDLETIRYMDCLNFFEKQFKNPSKIINVSKGQPFKIDVEFSNSEIDKKFEFGPYKDVILEPTRNYGDKVSICLTSKTIEDDFSYVIFINNMLTLGLSSPFYSEIREKRGLVYHIGCHQSRMNDQGVNIISTETSNKNVELLIDSFKDVMKNPDKFISKKRFDLVRRSYLIKFQKDKINRFQNINNWINPTDWSVKEIIKTINYDKVMDVYDKYFKFDDFYISNDRTEFN